MNLLVLGGNGYLGSKICNFFSNSNKIYCTIRKGELPNLLCINKNVIVIDSDISKVKEIIKQENIDVLINTVCCYERSKEDFTNVIEANMKYPLDVITYAIEKNIGKILTIDTSLPENVNLYSLSKKVVSKIGNYYCSYYNNVTFYNILLENFYGEDEPKNRFLHQTIDKLKNNTDIELTSGTQKRDFIYITDVLNAISILIYNKDEKGYYDVPIGTGEGPSIREVVEYLKEITKSKSTLLFGAKPSRANEPSCIADMTYLNNHGFKLEYTYKKGLKKLV